MIGQYLPNNNETATLSFRQKFYQLNSPFLSLPTEYTVHSSPCQSVYPQQLLGSTEPTTAQVQRSAQPWTGADMST
jgi:hypothetical protein